MRIHEIISKKRSIFKHIYRVLARVKCYVAILSLNIEERYNDANEKKNIFY